MYFHGGQPRGRLLYELLAVHAESVSGETIDCIEEAQRTRVRRSKASS